MPLTETLKSAKMLLNRRIIIPAVLSLALAGGCYYSISAASESYKKHKAKTAIVATHYELEKLDSLLEYAKQRISNSKELMCGNEETEPLYAEIKDAESKKAEIAKAYAQAQQEFDNSQFDLVREQLDISFGLGSSQTRETPQVIAKSIATKLETNVISYCADKEKNMDAAVKNRWYLMARLNKPLQYGMSERPAGLAQMPENLYQMIPKKTSELEQILKGLTPEKSEAINPDLYNSLGENLARHKKTLEHIEQFGKNDSAKAAMQQSFVSAFALYAKAKKINDSIKWYKGEEHSRKLSLKVYNELLAKQNEAIELIRTGDYALVKIEKYFSELHTQFFEFVSGHDNKEKDFRHNNSSNSTGQEFFYTLTRVTPSGESHKTVRVGEIDGSEDWHYAQHEQVGWVQKWKRVHYGNHQIVHGWAKDLQPHIEKLQDCCVQK